MIGRAIQGEGCEQRDLAVCSPECQNSRLYPFLVRSDGLIHSFHRVFHRNCEKSPGFPTMFSTFSTEFSTFSCETVYTWCIVPRGSLRKFREFRAFAPFFRKKVKPENLLFTAGKNPLVKFLPVGMKETAVFHTRFLQKSTRGKQRENLSFQQKETALSVIAARCHLSQRARLCCLYLRSAIGSPFGGAGKAVRL